MKPQTFTANSGTIGYFQPQISLYLPELVAYCPA